MSGVRRACGRLLHEFQSLLDAFVAHQGEERRLFELDGEALAQGAVEDGVAGGVGEITEDDDVFFGEFWRAMHEEVRPGRERGDQQDGNANFQRQIVRRANGRGRGGTRAGIHDRRAIAGRRDAFPDDGLAGAPEEPRWVALAEPLGSGAASSSAAGSATLRPLESRFRRCRSVRMSAACW